MSIDLPKYDAAIRDAEYSYAIGTIVLRLADNPHLAARCPARKRQSVAHDHSHFVLEQNADSFAAFPKRRTRQLGTAF